MALRDNVKKWGDMGFRGLTVQGSNGSYPYLLISERIELIEKTKECIDDLDMSDRLLLMAGAGAESTLETQRICEAIAQLADHPNICGVKDSGGDIAKIGQILWLTEGKRFQVLAGSASFLHPAVSLGASGGVCALANVCGKEVVDLYNASANGDLETASMLQKRLIGPNQAVTKVFGVPGLKVAMGQYGYAAGHLRAPLRDLPPQEADKVKQIFKS